MLVYKAKTVLSVVPVTSKPYDFLDPDTGKQLKGTTIKGTVTVIGTDDRVAVITVKGKSVDEAQKKLDALGVTVGKPAEIRLEGRVIGGVQQLTA